MRLVLASASPRRRELLEAAGFAFDIVHVDVDERQMPGESADRYVERLARSKAEAGAAVTHSSDAVVLGADTAVVVDGEVLGKPVDDADAARMLARLSGRAHDVVTGVAVVHAGRTRSHVERTIVWMTPISPDATRTYIKTGEPMDKAGAYAIQGYAARFIPRIEGSYSNVVGLPVAVVLQLLEVIGAGQFSA